MAEVRTSNDTFDERGGACAFTLVELLVVIGIIAVLIGLLIPVLGRARQQAKMLVEQSAGRQLMLAYQMYSGENRGWLVPAYVSSDNLVAVDNAGNAIVGEPVKRWPWRLMPYCKFGLKGTVLVNEIAVQLDNPGQLLWSYQVSLNPAFGMNYQGLGGAIGNGWDLPTLSGGGKWWCCRRAGQVTRTTERIVFLAARGPGGLGGSVPSEGYFRVVSPIGDPYFATSPAWDEGNYDQRLSPEKFGYAAPRWKKDKAVTAMFDGHVELLTLDQLRDMRHWSEQAAQTGNANWTP